MHLSTVDVLVFLAAAGAIMAYQAWFFIATTIRTDKAADAEAQARLLEALDAAVARGDAVLLEEYRSSRADASAGGGAEGGGEEA